MASDSDERRSVLLAVRDQAKVLRGQPPTQGNSEAWTPQQWWQSFDYLVRGVGFASYVNGLIGDRAGRTQCFGMRGNA